MGCSCFQGEQDLARAKGIPSQSVLGIRVQGTLVLLLKSYSLDFLGPVPLMVFDSLYISLIQK